MKTITNILYFLIVLLFINCTIKPKNTMEALENEVRVTELNFAKMAKEKGIAEAFIFYADENAVLMRNNQLIKGKSAIADYMKKSTNENITLEWEPDFVEVAASGDLAYTYGKYTLSIAEKDTLKQSSGIFHTVWKLQSNRTWKYVWD